MLRMLVKPVQRLFFSTFGSSRELCFAAPAAAALFAALVWLQRLTAFQRLALHLPGLLIPPALLPRQLQLHPALPWQQVQPAEPARLLLLCQSQLQPG